MTFGVFDDNSAMPDEEALTAALGRSKKLWDELIAYVAEEYAPLTQRWSFYKGWSLRLIRKKRTILYMLPYSKHFLCAFVFGGKASEAARRSDLPDAVITSINEAKVYAEGRGFRLEVRKKSDLKVMQSLAAIKMAN